MLKDTVQHNKLNILGKLSANLMHELRNPLSVVKLNLDYIKMFGEELPSELNETIESSSEALERLQYLVDTVNDFSKKNTAEKSPCSLNDITLKCLSLLKNSFNYYNTTVKYELDTAIPKIYFDNNKLLQIMLNLVTNAVEACEMNGRIIIKTTYHSDKSLSWQIEDNGSGIPDEVKEKIFEEFYTSKKKGTGLGLSVCKMILKEYFSDLSFESKINEGTKFIVRFHPKLIHGNCEQDINN